MPYADPEKKKAYYKQRQLKQLQDPEWRATRKVSSRRRYAANPVSRNNSRIKHMYGIDLAGVSFLRQKQDNKCAICKQTFAVTPCIDHDHGENKKVRGLLCKACNSGLGHFRDNIDSLQQAIDYLQEQIILEVL
jgi:hypothetical protein